MRLAAREADNPEQMWLDDSIQYRDLLETMLRYPKPIIAAVNGPALAGGLGLVLASDLVIATDEAAQWVSKQMAAVLADRPPPNSVDLARLTPGSDMATTIETTLAPFYERAFGGKVVMDTQAGTQ